MDEVQKRQCSINKGLDMHVRSIYECQKTVSNNIVCLEKYVYDYFFEESGSRYVCHSDSFSFASSVFRVLIALHKSFGF